MNHLFNRQGRQVVQEPDADIDELAHRVMGVAIEVYRQLGPGFLEAIYEDA